MFLAFCTGFAVVCCVFCMCDGRHFRSVTLAASHIVSGLASNYVGLCVFFVQIWTTPSKHIRGTHFGHRGDVIDWTLHVHLYGHCLNCIFLDQSWTLRTAHG